MATNNRITQAIQHCEATASLCRFAAEDCRAHENLAEVAQDCTFCAGECDLLAKSLANGSLANVLECARICEALTWVIEGYELPSINAARRSCAVCAATLRELVGAVEAVSDAMFGGIMKQRAPRVT